MGPVNDINYILEYSEFSINTGFIYHSLVSNWSQYPRELFPELETKLETVLMRAKIVTASDENDNQYFESKIDKLIYRQEKAAISKNFPPYTEYFVIPQNKGYSLTAYKTSYKLTKDSDPEEFDFFFALSLLICNQMKVKRFFEYHLQHSFNNNLKEYKDFLSPLFVKYSYLLVNGKIDQLYINFMSEKNSEPTKSSKEEVSGARKILALHYIFEELLKEDRLNKPKMRLVQMLTGLGPDRVKQLMKSPLTNKVVLTDQLEDFKFVRQYFVDLKMDKIVIKIDKDIVSINNDK